MKESPVRMKRKLQQLGSSTLAVTVPADWVRQHGLETGDEVIIQGDENGGSLLVVPEQPSIDDTDATITVYSLTEDAVERATDGTDAARVPFDVDVMEPPYYLRAVSQTPGRVGVS